MHVDVKAYKISKFGVKGLICFILLQHSLYYYRSKGHWTAKTENREECGRDH